MAFDMKSYLETVHTIARHPRMDECIHTAIRHQLSTRSRQYTVLDPLVIADIGCADGSFTNDVVERIIVKEYDIQHVTTYNIDPYGMRDDHNVITLRHDDFSKHFPARHCDLIICRGAAHLFDGYLEWLTNCCRILKAGGGLYILNLSATMDWSNHWGQDAHRTYLESVNEPNSMWQARDGPLPNADDVHVGLCAVKHNHFTERIRPELKGWRMLIEKKGFSNLMRLSDEEVSDALNFIDQKYGDSKTVEMDLKWTLSVVSKQGGFPRDGGLDTKNGNKVARAAFKLLMAVLGALMVVLGILLL